jgi:hypothetical protein
MQKELDTKNEKHNVRNGIVSQLCYFMVIINFWKTVDAQLAACFTVSSQIKRQRPVIAPSGLPVFFFNSL